MVDYGCDQHFPYELIDPRAQERLLSVPDPDQSAYTPRPPVKHFVLTPGVKHDEDQYLGVLREVMRTGEVKVDRTGVGTRGIFGTRMVFDLRDRLPVLTTKRIFYGAIIKELLFFISGKTDTKLLSDQGVKIWDANTTKDALAKQGLPFREGDMGPGYGHQWRHFGAAYTGCDSDYAGQGVDQLQNLVRDLQANPHSRRHILTAWNPAQIAQMALPSCHVMAQFNVSGDGVWLDCQLYQRSGDLFLGVPFNITSYALLTAMLGHVTGLRPRTLIHVIGDAHIYSNHEAQVKTQLSRCPRPFPRLSFRDDDSLRTIDDFVYESFVVENYTSWPAIAAEMAV
jgi:thymidylate synthase